jgi:tRNA pseudouridine38-40 synthase
MTGEAAPRVFKLTLQYDGTDYVGWQRQAAGTSVQGLLEDVLQPIEGGRVVVHGAGRTDAGVHALGQVCSFRLAASIEPRAVILALNAVLPPDVRVTDAEVMPGDFHARFSSTGKIYDYRIVTGLFASPFVRRYVWHVRGRLDAAVMREASARFVGTHDFAAFQGHGAVRRTTVRTVTRLDWSGGGGPEDPLVMLIEGDGFLRHMVRNIAGTLVDIGLGRRRPSDIDAILAARHRPAAGPTAPASGLFLRQVLYSAKIAP